MDDILWGAAAIGKAISLTERQVNHMVATGRLPTRKVGGKLVASRRALIEAVLGESENDAA
jgi:hypothetical protein